MGLYGSVTDFQAFTVSAVLDTEAFNNWINTQKAAQSSQAQNLVTTTHNDVGHTDTYGSHYNTGYNDVAYKNVAHYDYTCYTNVAHTDNYNNAAHNEGAHNEAAHRNSSYYDAKKVLYTNWPHVDWPHVDWPYVNAHYETPYKNFTGNHTDIPYANTPGYAQSGYSQYPHNEAAHIDVGVSHQEYVPYTPAFYNLSASKCINGVFSIGFYSYDANQAGSGSQDASSKTVQYTLKIRKVSNLDGTSNVSNWYTLVSNTVSNTYNLNTVDPFGTGNTNPLLTEGYYEIQATASNPSITDAQGTTTTFISPPQTVQVLICQNTPPDLTITDADDFINFYFNDQGLAQATNFKPYANAWTAPKTSMTEGFYVSVSIRDTDTAAVTANNYQKGTVFLRKADGTPLTTPVTIYWDDTGTTTTSSQNSLKTGYAFIPKANFIGTPMNNVTVVAQIQDFLDAACTKPVGDVVLHTQVSSADSRVMNINIGWPLAQVPVLTAGTLGSNSITLKTADSNISQVKYQIYTLENNIPKYYIAADGSFSSIPQWITLNGKSISVLNLVPYTTYNFQAKAMNGDGVISIASTPLSVTTLPAAPSNITYTASSRSIVINWPLVAGASTYAVSMDSGNTTLAETPMPSHTATGLEPGKEYKFWVNSRNSNGSSEWSTITIVTPLEVPVVNAVSSGSSITLNWSSVPNATSYDISIGDITRNVTETSITIDGLNPNTTYVYGVRAKNDISSSAWSSSQSKLTRIVKPGAPVNLTAEAGTSTIRIVWDAVEGATTYQLCADGVVINSGTGTNYMDIGLRPGTSRTYMVRSVNSGGKSEWSSPLVCSTLPVDPNIPANLQSAVSGDTITLAWEPVQNAVSYDIEIDNPDISETNPVYIVNVSGTDYTLQGLAQESIHTFRVRVEIDGVAGPWSEVVKACLGSNPQGIPQSISTPVLTDSEISLLWDSVADATGYEVEENGIIIANTRSVSFSDKQLSPNTHYTFRVRAVNAAGVGAWSEPIEVTTLETVPLSVPGNIIASPTDRLIHLVWNPVDGATGYEVEVNGDSVLLNTTENVLTIQGLNPEFIYKIRVRAVNDFIAGNWSGEAITSTLSTSQASQIDQTISSTYVADVQQDEEFDLELNAEDISNITGTTFTLTFNANELEIADLCAFTLAEDTGEGSIPDTDLQITLPEAGKIIIKLNIPDSQGQSFSGLVNLIRFRSKISGQSTVTYTISQGVQ